MYIGISIIGLLILFTCIIVIRALLFKPEIDKKIISEYIDLDQEKLISNFQALIKCPTVSYNDSSKIEHMYFQEFRDLLINLYPGVHEVCKREEISNSGILYCWKGKKSDAVTVLMSHYDVVPANDELWSKPPFSAILEDGLIWGRGTLDTKGTLCGILEAAELLISQGYIPENDIYFSFSGDEEISGPSAPAIVETLRNRNIKPALVLDEGGAVVEGIFPGIDKPCAVVGVGEKGYIDLSLEIQGQGGHSSAPPAHSLVGVLAKAIINIEKKPFKASFTPPVIELFETLGKHASFGMRVIFANLWCFKPLLKLIFRKSGGEMNALIRTTMAVTKLEGSKSYNVLPPKASIGINLRLLSTDTVESATSYIQKLAGDERISLSIVESRAASPTTKTNTSQWKTVKSAIQGTWKDTIVAPYLMLAASDSRHFCAICDNVLRFSAMPLSSEERKLIHGNDERIPVTTLVDTVGFYVRLIKGI